MPVREITIDIDKTNRALKEQVRNLAFCVAAVIVVKIVTTESTYFASNAAREVLLKRMYPRA